MPVTSPRRTTALPLDQFPAEQRKQIQAVAAQPTKPPRYLQVSAADSLRPVAAIESRAWWEWHWQRGIDPDRARRLSPQLRALVIARDGLRCGICQGAVSPHDIHIDHIHPVHAGGTDDPHNLQVTHATCNLRKGART